MGNMLATWEDKENNRQIQFSITYSIEKSGVNVTGINPQKVSFVCPETNTCLRTIGVHTESGRELLAEKIRHSGQMSDVISEIAKRYNLAVAV